MVNVSNSMLVLAPEANLFDSKKGSIGNRAECWIKQEAAQLKDTVELGAAAGAAGLGYHTINKNMAGKAYAWNTKVNNELKNFVKEMVQSNDYAAKSPFTNGAFKSKNGRIIIDKMHDGYKSLSKSKKIFANIGSKVINTAINLSEKLCKTSARQKVLEAFVGAAVLGLLFLAQKQGFHRGQIDQKYNDRAIAQKLSN